ncbi:MAG: amidohydrolase [Synergistaceae bacterium]|jgi:predicted amidohydrolase YtcJ|nr:amidohydrolase [Synergistaceae bacterium]
MDGPNGKKIALVNGRIHTPLGMREALSIEAGRIAELGKTSDIAPGADTVVDLKERPVFPGFADSHMHFMMWMESQELINLRPCRSIEDLRTVLRAHIGEHPLPDAGWYRGTGWNQTSMPEGRAPNRFDLDDIAPDRPVMLTRVCGHVAVLNTAGLNAAGVTRDTCVEGGIVELDEEGEPTGLVAEEAVGYVHSRIPGLQDEDMLRLLEKYGPQAASFGLTQLNTDDMSAFGFDFRRAIGFYTAAEREGKLPFRVRQQFLLPRRELLLDFLSEGWRTGDGTPLYQIGPLKLLCDGSLGGRTAFLREDYADMPGSRGVAIYGQEELNGLAALAHSSGMQVAVHAIGDGAFEMCLGAFEAAQTACPGAARHQIVHAQIAGDRQLDRMKSLRLGALIQPCFVPSDREMAIARLGGERAGRSYRWKTMLKKGIPLAAGSDAPIESLRPLDGVHAAVTRQEQAGRAGQSGEPESGWTPEENLSVAEALSLYTWANAWQSGNERRRGEIAPGRDADLTVLEQDPFLVSASDIWKIGVAMTLCGGRITYRAAME